jgi:hypothetical protein
MAANQLSHGWGHAPPARRAADPLPSIPTVRDAWGGRSRLTATLDAAMDWLRDVTRRATRAVVNAFQAHPVAGGMLILGVIGGAFVLAPQASWALLKRAAASLARNAGRVVAATVLAEVCPDCWEYA